MKQESLESTLQRHFHTIEKIILSRQDPLTGLLPASTSVNAHGDYTDAWVRDNVYSILSVWGLALAYKKNNPNNERSYMLGQSVVKLMRGLLRAMMGQADRLERFKSSLDPMDALHAKYGTATGLAVVADDGWGHLQLDATSLYLLMTAQMIASGLKIIYTLDEVDFVQNLVHYVSRSYCTPDYGIWERGNKINRGTTEINCSSVGMAKAALEAMDGFNLFGDIPCQEAVVHVVAGDIAHSRFTLHSLLPRESNSKESDAALLSIIGYPAYAVEDEVLVKRTQTKIIKKLAGHYGCKRFLLDGHQSSIEDSSRLHYEPSELREFEEIESEWPLFFTYLLLDALMREDSEAVQKWQKKLLPLFVKEDGELLLPELYIVPQELIAAEKLHPGSQTRVPNENLPLVWAQSLYMLSQMMLDSVLTPSDIDPLCRRERIGHAFNTKPLVSLLAENESVKERLQTLGFSSETVDEVKPVKIFHASQLSKLHTLLGRNEKLGISGRPLLEVRTITTSRAYLLGGVSALFLPYYFNPKAFYFSYDNKLLIEHFRSSLKFLSRQWDKPSQPIVPFLVRESMLIDPDCRLLIGLLEDLQRGSCNGFEIETAPLERLLKSAFVERIDELDLLSLEGISAKPSSMAAFGTGCGDKKQPHLGVDQLQKLEAEDDNSLVQTLVESGNRRLQAYALELLYARKGESFELVVADESLSLASIAQKLYEEASLCHDWGVLRHIADITDKYDDRIEDVLLDIIIHHKRLAVGRAYSEKATFSTPHDSAGIVKTIKEFCGNNLAESVLTQEIVLHLGHLIRTEPERFMDMLTLRTWSFVQLMVGQVSREHSLPMGEAYMFLLDLAPHDIYEHLRLILSSFKREREHLQAQENLHVSGLESIDTIKLKPLAKEELGVKDWAQWRHSAGMIGHLYAGFYKDVWYLLQQCRGLVIGDKYSTQSRIGSELTLESTPGERSFELIVDALLHGIAVPEYRQLNIEVIESLARVFRQSPHLHVENDLVLDVLIGHAVRIAWSKEHNEADYDEQKGQAWKAIYKCAPKETESLFVEAFIYLMTQEKAS